MLIQNIENIRVIKGTNFDYFSEEGKNFLKKNLQFQNYLIEWE